MDPSLMTARNQKEKLYREYKDLVEEIFESAQNNDKSKIIALITQRGGIVDPKTKIIKNGMTRSTTVKVVGESFKKFESIKNDAQLISEAQKTQKAELEPDVEEESKAGPPQNVDDSLSFRTEPTKATSDSGTRKKQKETENKETRQARQQQEDISMMQRAMQPQFSRLEEIIQDVVGPALNSQAGKNFVKLPIVRARNPELASAIISGTKNKFNSEDEKSLSEAASAVHQSSDPNAKGRLSLFIKQIQKEFIRVLEKQKPDDDSYNQATSGIPKIQQNIAQPLGNKMSANGTIAVNGSGFAGQRVQPLPEEIYNAVTGEIRVTQYNNQKEKFLKETYHKVRNLHPEVKQGAEKVLTKLQNTYASKILEQHSEYPGLVDKFEAAELRVKQSEARVSKFKPADKKSKEYKEANLALALSRKNKNILALKIKDIYDELVQEARAEPELENPHRAAKERKEVQYHEFEISQAKKKQLEELGRQEAEGINAQNRPMEENLERGSSSYTSGHSQNQNSQRDPGSVYNDSRVPGYHDVYPYLKDIVKLLEKEEKSDSQQAQLDLAVLDEKDPFKLLQAIEFLNSQYAAVPLTSKEQQRIRNESEAISRRIGRDQVFYPYNQKEISLLQGGLSKYYDANGGVVHQPALKKSYYEALQKAEQKGVRKDLEFLHGVKESDKLENVKKAQIKALGEDQYKSLFPNFLSKKQRNSKKSNLNPSEEVDDELGEISINDIVKAIHQLVKYTSKINGNIDLADTNLEKYKTKTTVFTPAVAKKENNAFSFTAASAFKLRPC